MAKHSALATHTPCKRMTFLLPLLLASSACNPAEKAETPAPVAPPRAIALPSSTTRTSADVQQKRESYRNTLDALAKERTTLRARYTAAQNSKARTAVLEAARETLTRTLLTDIFPAWDGTPWDFNGISETPGEGSIACGYFVTTTLRDAGMKLPRIKLAQQPSQTIIRSLCVPETIRVYYEKPLETFVQHVKEHGPGIYIVGLDCHTGFVVHEGGKMRFVHSSYFRPPRAVISEPLDSDNPLHRSKYRMIGKCLGDELLRQWLKQEDVAMKK
jgi:hypothetical protein